MTKKIEGFQKKDFGAIIYRALAYCLTVCGILLLFQKNIAEDILVIGIKTVSILAGAGLFLCFYFNARTRFRPGWTLPMAFVMSIFGAGSILVDLFLKDFEPSIGISSVVIVLFMLNGVLLLSSGIQLKALCLRRWISVFVLGLLSLVVAIIIFFNLSLVREKPYLCVSLFMFMLALQSFLEGVYNWKK